jgi:hypothetical protein
MRFQARGQWALSLNMTLSQPIMESVADEINGSLDRSVLDRTGLTEATPDFRIKHHAQPGGKY